LLRLILDITPNHSSASHPWFLAAQADPAAPPAEFYTFHQRPHDYATWLGVRSLPKLNYRSERLRAATTASRPCQCARTASPTAHDCAST
jgi:alpha-glucosidase